MVKCGFYVWGKSYYKLKLSEAVMEHLCCREKLRELRLFSPEKALGRP